MYSGALMPPSPIRPMNRPWPIHSGQGGPKVEIERPRPIISEPQMTVQRVPIRSAMRDMMIPPAPEPSHASALAKAGMERCPCTSLAMSLSATTLIQAPPNDIPRTNSATEATAQEALVSMECGGCNIGRDSELALPFPYRRPGNSPPTSTWGLLYCCTASNGGFEQAVLGSLCRHRPGAAAIKVNKGFKLPVAV